MTIDNIESGTDGQGVERERCKQVDPVDFDPTHFDFSCFHPLNEVSLPQPTSHLHLCNHRHLSLLDFCPSNKLHPVKPVDK